MKSTQLILLLLSVAASVQYTWLSGSSTAIFSSSCDADSTGDGPSARDVTQLRRCPGRPNTLYLITGQASDVCGDVWMFSLVTLSWTQLISHADSPLYRDGPASWCDLNDHIWLYGGSDEFHYGRSDLWGFNTSTNEWSLIMNESPLSFTEPVHPGDRRFILHTVDTDGNLIMFSGSDIADVCDLWMFRVDEGKWELLYYDNNAGNEDVTRPPGLDDRGILIVNDNIITIGFGYLIGTLTSTYGSFWEFDITTNTWERVYSTTGRNLPAEFGVFDSTNSPGPHAGALHWSYDSNIYIAMGEDGITGNAVNDVWIWNISLRQWAWLAGSGIYNDPGEYNEISQNGIPASRSYAWFIDDPGNDLPLSFFFGGYDENEEDLSDFWLIDLDNGIKCEENEYFYYGTKKCYSCENGTYSHGNTTTCLLCDTPTSSTVCSCSTWSYWNGSKCIECDDNSHWNGSECIECDDNTHWNGSDCIECDDNTHWNGSDCIECDDNSHWNGSECIECDDNSHWNGSECIECPLGYYRQENHCLPCQHRILANGSTESLCTGQVCHNGFELNQNHNECVSISILVNIRTIGVSVSLVTATTTSVATIVTLLSTSYDATSTWGSDSSASTGQFCALMGMINEWQSGLSLAFSSGFAWMMGLFEYPFIRISESEFSASSSLERFLQYSGVSVESMFRVVVTSYFILVAIDTFVFGFYGLVVKFYTDKSLESTARNFFRSLTYIWTFMFYPITIASMVELRNFSQTGTGRQLSSIFALGIGSLMFFPLLLFGYEKERRRRTGATNFYSSVFITFYAPFADNRMHYAFIPLISRLLKCLCIVFLSGIGQVLSLTLIYCITLCLVVVLNPYKSTFTKYNNVVVLILYISVCLLQCISVFLTSDGDILSTSRIALQIALLVSVLLGKVRTIYKIIMKSKRNLQREQADSMVQ